MKKLFVTALAILASGAAYALPVGNPCEASLLCDGLFFEGDCCDPCDPCMSWCDAFSFRLGFYGDYVFNRNLRVRSDDDGEGSRVEHTKLFTNAGYIALNFWNRADIFGTVGTTNFCFDTNVDPFSITGNNATSRLELESSAACPSWSVGARATLWECGCTCLGIEGQYFRAKPRTKRITQAALLSVYPDDFYSTTYKEWQVGLGISHRINFLVPYVAVKWSGARWDLNNQIFDLDPLDTIILRDLRNHKRWGYAVGVSLVDCEKAALTVEGRFADEKAVYVNGQVRF